MSHDQEEWAHSRTPRKGMLKSKWFHLIRHALDCPACWINIVRSALKKAALWLYAIWLHATAPNKIHPRCAIVAYSFNFLAGWGSHSESSIWSFNQHQSIWSCWQLGLYWAAGLCSSCQSCMRYLGWSLTYPDKSNTGQEVRLFKLILTYISQFCLSRFMNLNGQRIGNFWIGFTAKSRNLRTTAVSGDKCKWRAPSVKKFLTRAVSMTRVL